MKPVPHGEPYAGKLHVRFDEGAGVPDEGRPALLYTLGVPELVCGGDNCTVDGVLGLQPLEGEIFGRFYFVSVSKDFSGWLNKRVDTSKFRKEYHFEFKNPLAR